MKMFNRRSALAYTTIFTLAVAFAVPAVAQQKVDRKGAASTVKLQQVISSHLTEINGKSLLSG